MNRASWPLVARVLAASVVCALLALLVFAPEFVVTWFLRWPLEALMERRGIGDS